MGLLYLEEERRVCVRLKFEVVVVRTPVKKGCDQPWCQDAEGEFVEVIERLNDPTEAASVQIGFNTAAIRSPTSRLWAIVQSVSPLGSRVWRHEWDQEIKELAG